MITEAEGLALTLFVGVPVAIWDGVWLVTGYDSAARRSAFMVLYHLEIVTIVVDEVPLEVVRPLSGYDYWWVVVVAWLLDPASACAGGCTQSQRPVM